MMIKWGGFGVGWGEVGLKWYHDGIATFAYHEKYVERHSRHCVSTI